MRSQNRWTGIVVGIVMGVLFSAAVLLAGSLEPGVGPAQDGSQMVTLEQIYNRINNGTAAAKMAEFTEPSSGPTAGTMHTLDEIYALAGLRAPVPRTGQTPINSPAYSDGALQKGVVWPNPRFTVNMVGNESFKIVDGTVTDNLTGLIWLKNANCTNFFSGDSTGGNNRTWPNALTAANSLASGRCGLVDGSTAGQWRLPNVREMQSLIDYGRNNPALPSSHPFTGVQSVNYWSSTLADLFSSWCVYLLGGTVYDRFDSDTLYVWPVRGGQ